MGETIVEGKHDMRSIVGEIIGVVIGGRNIEEKGVLSDRPNSVVDLLVCGTVRVRMGGCVVHEYMIVEYEGM